jgi:hypothetical protein
VARVSAVVAVVPTIVTFCLLLIFPTFVDP